ncbi:MAG: SDR family NAD(P)-dependent oxidoreductase [Streptosporangiales bacterium]|nr:SDR family NAD(P)-dependent oxidoreductase [Streptosporangiales bacterium]
MITGASSGIGAAIARELASRGHGVTLVARREERLRDLANELAEAYPVRAEVLACDLADAAARGALPGRVEALGLRVDVLVNNAGLGTHGRFVELDAAREAEQVRVLCEAVVDLCGAFAPAMAARRSGGVLIVSSLSGFQPVPNTATYAAAKAFSLSFGETLHAELRGCGVSVTTLCPGPVDTEFFEVSGPHPTQRVFPKPLWETAEAVARAGIEGLARNRRVVVPGAAMRALVASGRLAPGGLRLWVLDRFYRGAEAQ